MPSKEYSLQNLLFEYMYHAFKESRRVVWLRGRLSYCNAKTASLMKEVLFTWDIRGNYATKSTLADCVKRFCLGCI